MMIDDDLLKKLGPVDTIVYTMIANNPHITQKELATNCNLCVRTVINVVKRLAKENYIKIKVNKPYPNTYEVMRQTTKKSMLTLGEFGLVHLTEPELKKLQNKYPKIVIEDYIQRIDTFMYNNKSHKLNTYHTHYATIKLWIDGDLRQNGGYTTHRSTKTLAELRRDQEYVETIEKIIASDAEKIENYEKSDTYTPTQWEIADFYDVPVNNFHLHQNLHGELIARRRPTKIKVPREICEGDAEREYYEELQLKIAPNTHKGSWGMLVTDAMYYVEQYKKYYKYLDDLKEKAKNKSKEFLEYVGYHEGDE